MINENREDLKTDLAALGIPIYTTYQDKVPKTPCILIVPPANDYVSPGDTFSGSVTISFDVVVIVDLTDSTEEAQLALEEIIDNILELKVDWLTRPTVSAPSQVDRNNISYLASVITVSKIIGV
jgi:hypothetical protein